MKSLYRNYETEIDSAYIIYLPDNIVSSALANRCLKSCQDLQQKAELWEGFDGTDNADIIVPNSHKDKGWIKWLKVTDHHLSKSEVACALSHISLWVKCMEDDKPIIIFEHDAVLIKKVLKHSNYNTIQYLGCLQQLGHEFNKDVSWLSSINKNWYTINRAHAYSIDPIMAKNLFKTVLDRGIYESLDVMLQIDYFSVIQYDIYAYDDPGPSTISSRKKSTDTNR